MKILFLDVDGVLNSVHWYNTRPDEPIMGRRDELYTMIDSDAMDRLNRIIVETKCRLVLSSSWRAMDPISMINAALRMRGCDTYLFGITPSLGSPRGEEIQVWLNMAEPSVDGFVILDDDSDMVHLSHRLVQTTWEAGLQDEHVARAIEMLK